MDRFWAKVDKTSNDCWEWLGGKTDKGYGSFRMGSHMGSAHRLSYAFWRGPIPEGLHLDHLCRVRGCVNPWHLEPVTQAENVRRGDLWKVNGAKKECPRGHEYDYQRPSGGRDCKECKRDATRRWRARNKA